MSHTSKSTAKHTYDWRYSILIVVGLLCLAVGGYMLYARFTATHGTVTVNPRKVVTNDADEPSEQKPDPATRYTVDATMPRRIIVPAIDVDGYIQQVGLADNRLVAPNNVNLAGWFNKGPLPGQDGIAIIDGHVSGKYSDGIFKRLALLHKDDQVTIEFGNLSKQTFIVKQVSTVPVGQAGQAMFTNPTNGTKALNLITCGGRYDRNSQSYTDRTIVYTVPV